MTRWLRAVCLGLIAGPLTAAPPVTALAFAPDGKAVVVGSQAGVEVRRWPSLERDRVIQPDMPNVHDLAFSPDGKLLAVAGGTPGKRGTVEFYRWPDGKRLRGISPHRDCVYQAAWRADSAVLLTASLDRTVGILSVDSAQPPRLLEGHSRGVLAVAFLPGEAEIVSAGVDESVRLWDAKTGEPLRTLANHTRPVTGLAVRPGSRTPPLVVSVGEDRTVRLWQPTIGRLVRFARLDSVPLAAAWSADGGRIITACKDGRVRALDPDTMELVETLPGVDGVATCLAVAPDGGVLVGGRDGQVQRVRLSR